MSNLRILIILGASACALSLSSDVVIGSFNLRREGKEALPERSWTNRLPAVSQMILAQAPTVIGFQEATKSQIQHLKEALPAYAGIGTSRGKSWFGLAQDEAVPLFFDTNKVTLLAGNTFFIHSSSLWIGKSGFLPRICTWGLFHTKDTGQKFYVLNIHLDHAFESARLNNLKHVINWIKDAIKDPTIPVFIVGDFNTELTPIIKAALPGFSDVRDMANNIQGSRETHTAWGKGPFDKIDHILIKSTTAILVPQYNTIIEENNLYLSDHRPIFATIAL